MGKYSSTYVEVRRTAIRVFVIRSKAIEVFHRATIEAVGIHWVAILPVAPDLVKHLSSKSDRDLSAISVN
jgi:hypothetical protein